MYQGQDPSLGVMSKKVLPPPAGIGVALVVGLTLKVQGAEPAWLIVNVAEPPWFPTVILAERGPDEFDVALSVTVPLPLPPNPLAIDTHGGLKVGRVTFHAQELLLGLTRKVVVPPLLGIGVWLVAGLRVNVHGVPAACVRVTVRPATGNVPTRGAVVGFAITDQLADPLPVLVTPLLPTVIQGNAGF